MRTCERTHPWIRFGLDLNQVNAHTWVMLGECKSKCEHIAGVPLRPKVATRLHNVYLAKGALATTAIEGNTLTEKEVEELVEGNLRLPPSRQYLGEEVKNIIAECNRMGQEIKEGKIPELSVERIKKLNKLVLDRLILDEGVIPGEVRKHNVTVGRYRGAPAEDCLYLLDRLCDWLNQAVFDSILGAPIVSAIIKAIVAHLYLAWIHPFGDGNGRTARLVEFQILLSSGVPTPATHLLSNHYNLTRTRYYKELDDARKSPRGVFNFLSYAVQGFVDGLRSQINEIMEQQLDVAWRNYVYERFGGDKARDKDLRRRELVLALSRKKGIIPIGELTELNPKVAKQYAGKTRKTLSRDLNELRKMDLIERTKQGVRARKELIRAFLPAKASKEDILTQQEMDGEQLQLPLKK